MKVDVITRHAIGNYGSILQAYATQKVFEKLGYECDIIDYQRNEEKGKEICNNLLKKSNKWNKNILTRQAYRILQFPNFIIQYNNFKKYRAEILKQTREYNTIDDLRENLPDADIFCTGSDQVWGEIGNVAYDEAYFLKFVPSDKKCIAYSASFGKKNNDEEMLSKLPELLKNYSKIMVREDSAVEIIKSKNIDNVEQVIDPVMLLEKSEWESFAKKDVVKKGEYILVYQLHDNKEFERYAKQFSKKKKMKLIRISPSLSNVLKCGKTVLMPTPQQFLSYFMNAKYVLTDSFHGTVFSMIFNKNFVDILPKRGVTRMESVLRKFNLEHRLVRDNNDFSVADKPINYEMVNDILSGERENSLNKLKNAIEN